MSERVLQLLSSLVQGHPRLSALSQREHELLDLVAAGRCNADVAQVVPVSENTVRNHVSSIFMKLGAATRSEAIVLARDAGLGQAR